MKKLQISAETRKKVGKGAHIAATLITGASTVASAIMLGKAMKDGDAKKITGFGATTIASTVLFTSTVK